MAGGEKLTAREPRSRRVAGKRRTCRKIIQVGFWALFGHGTMSAHVR
jgi:hypothetical protein